MWSFSKIYLMATSLLLYLNDMPQGVLFELLLYANYTYLIFQHNDVKEIEIQLKKS